MKARGSGNSFSVATRGLSVGIGGNAFPADAVEISSKSTFMLMQTRGKKSKKKKKKGKNTDNTGKSE